MKFWLNKLIYKIFIVALCQFIASHELKTPLTSIFSYDRDETISMQFDEEKNWMDVNWTGYQNFKSVQEGCLIMLDLVKKNNTSKVLNDNIFVMGNWSEASDWGAAEWFPAMAAAGVKTFRLELFSKYFQPACRREKC